MLSTHSLFAKVALLVVGVNLVTEGIHILLGIAEALFVHVSTFTSACPMPALCVCWLRQANDRKDGIGGMAEASLVHGTGLCCGELACSTCIALRLEGTILVWVGHVT